MIPVGKQITFDVEGQTDALLPLDEADLRGGVIDILSKRFTVSSVGVTPRASVYVGVLDWPYSASVRLTTRESFGDAADISSIVANAFYQSGGSLPTVTARGYASSQAPGVSPTPSDGVGWGFGLWTFGLAAIAVAIFVAKRG